MANPKLIDESPKANRGDELTPKAYENDEYPGHKHHRVCGCLSTKTAQLLSLFFLIAALGCSIAPMTATDKGWAYYSTDHFYFKPGVVPVELQAILPLIATPAQIEAFRQQYTVANQGFFYESWVGWLKGTSTLRKWPNLSFLQCRNIPYDRLSAALGAAAPTATRLLQSSCLNEYKYLKEEDMSGQVWGGFTCGMLGLGGLTAFILYMHTFLSIVNVRRMSTRWTGRKAWWISLLWFILTMVFVCGLYIFLAVGVHRETERQLQWGMIPRPDWAFYVGLAAAFSWLITALLQRAMPREHVPIVPKGSVTDGQFPMV